jgi:hypothetical protein
MPADTLLAQANRRAGSPSGVARTLSTQITADVADPIKARRVPCGPSDAELDKAIKMVADKMKGDRTKNRVTVYYLLAEHFGKVSMFG